MEQMEAGNMVLSSLSYMSENAKPDLVALLQGCGFDVTTETDSEILLEASLLALKDSGKFRNMLTTYLQQQLGETSFSGNEEDFYSNVTGFGKALSGIGGFLKQNVFTKENIGAVVGAGIGYATMKLQDKANKSGDERAIELAKQQAIMSEANARAEAERSQQQIIAQQGGGAGKTSGTPKWVLPVAIGGGILILGTIIILATRK